MVGCIAAECGADVSIGSACWDAAAADGGECGAPVAACAAKCTPDCDGRECGPSGCGYACGTCAAGSVCNAGVCEEIQCDREGFAAETAVASWDEERARYYGLSAAAPLSDALIVELWWAFGAPTTPGSYVIQDQNYADCGVCVLGNAGCSEAGCTKTFQAFSGALFLTDVPNAMGEPLGGRLSNVYLREVTIDGFTSTPVAGGEVWCVDGFSFQLTTALGK